MAIGLIRTLKNVIHVIRFNILYLCVFDDWKPMQIELWVNQWCRKRNTIISIHLSNITEYLDFGNVCAISLGKGNKTFSLTNLQIRYENSYWMSAHHKTRRTYKHKTLLIYWHNKSGLFYFTNVQDIIMSRQSYWLMHISCKDALPCIVFVSLANVDVLVSKEKPIIAE